MCGIAGVWAYRGGSPVWAGELELMSCAMASRGPDGAGAWIGDAGDVGLVHRRLAVIDLSDAAAQPMHDPETGNVIVFNGEIYNYRELRERLAADGVAFRSTSDTEVLLHLYRLRGEAMVVSLRGMFAFAIWDARERALFLARDPLGIKPLYYADDGQSFRFASQVKALAAGGAVPVEPSAAGLTGFFLWGHVPEPWTWVSAVRALPAGSTLLVRPGTGPLPPRRYFDLREEIIQAEAAPPRSDDPAAAALDAVADSVAHHLIADVPVGVFLSSGRDSTLVAALAARRADATVRTITLGFQEYRGTGWDEVPGAEAAARILGTAHRTVVITEQDFRSELERILTAMDQPTIDGVNTYFVSRAAAASGLKVALSGLGGDELFGGYPSFTQVPRLVRSLHWLGWAPGFGQAVRAAAAPVARWLARPKLAGLIEYGTSVERAYLLRRALYMPWELPRLLDPDLVRQGLAELGVDDDLRERIRGIRTPAGALMALELSCYMQNQLLRDADWAGMAHSLEVRVPLVDAQVLRRWLPCAVRGLPFDRRRLLARAAPTVADLLGSRPKSGFATPVERWLRTVAPRAGDEPKLRPWARFVADHFAPNARGRTIAALLTDAYGSVGGIAKFNRDLLTALATLPECRRVDTYSRVAFEGREALPPKIRYHPEAAGGKAAFARAVAALAARTSERVELVICGHVNLLPLAWSLARVKRCPILVIVHGIEAWRPHRNPLVRLFIRRVDAIVAVSRFTAERVAAWTGLEPDRFRILPNCVDLEEYRPRPRDEALARRFGLDGRRVLLTVGRLAENERYKGLDEVLEALPELRRRDPCIAYVIVGDGPDRPRLEAKARSLGLTGHVVFAGRVSEDEKKAWYSVADAFVMPSRGEGFGIVFLEATASGVPVVAGSVDASREALLDGRLGILVDPADRTALVHAIQRALARARARPQGLEYFSVEAYQRRTREIIRGLLAQGGASAAHRHETCASRCVRPTAASSEERCES